mgnify:CR=1 FL=1
MHWSKKNDWIELLLFRKWSQRRLAAAILLVPPWQLIAHVSIEKEIICSLPANDVIPLNTEEATFFLNVVLPMTYSKLYGLYQRQNTGSRLFTEVKLCWTALITGSVTIWEISRAVLLSKSGWRCGHQSRLYYKCSRWPEFQSISTWLRGFSLGTQFGFPPHQKIDSLHYIEGHKFIS